MECVAYKLTENDIQVDVKGATIIILGNIIHLSIYIPFYPSIHISSNICYFLFSLSHTHTPDHNFTPQLTATEDGGLQLSIEFPNNLPDIFSIHIRSVQINKITITYKM